MNPEAFNRWLVTMKISAVEASRLLGVHPNTITKYRAKPVPLTVALACRALYHRLPPWPKQAINE